LDFVEEFMANLDNVHRRESNLSGWNIAAALGLLAVAFLVDRGVPERRRLADAAQRKRDASPASLATESEDRGRHAASPAEIPAKGWKDILLRIYGNIGNHRILALAAGMTYYSILAIFPALAALVAIYGFFSDPGSIAKHLDEISGFVPGGAIEIAREHLTRVAAKDDRTLGLTFAVGLMISLWSTNAAMKSLFDTLNIVYGEQEKRGFVMLNAISLSFTVAGIAFVLPRRGANSLKATSPRAANMAPEPCSRARVVGYQLSSLESHGRQKFKRVVPRYSYIYYAEKQIYKAAAKNGEGRRFRSAPRSLRKAS
jgi:membrane protein